MRVISGGGWQPHGCRLPRFNATELLERSRNGRIVFAGDSLGRNQWESLLCMLSRSVSNLSNIYEVYGNPISKHKGYLSMMFADYNLTVNTTGPPFWSHPAVLLRTPLLMSKGPCGWMKCTFTQGFGPGRMCWCAMPVIGGTKTRRIRWGSIFRKKGALNMSMDVVEGFGKGSGNEGGRCNDSTEPLSDPSSIRPDPFYNYRISKTIREMKRRGNRNRTKVHFLNITGLTEYRRDGHPSSHRELGTPENASQDCSHWCLPGVPDTWNEILYATAHKRRISNRQRRLKPSFS
ncbi:hypothetical protein MLD38_026646 [Melastoma candidum]|uniref:Uncharacterized protein n=1 Tax=Melastoma candidum TaxID=119954 RepID=A0ACB9P144_9MYRT|nr:hypothetical protein MLD38_026646 [Melastoma candidum]